MLSRGTGVLRNISGKCAQISDFSRGTCGHVSDDEQRSARSGNPYIEDIALALEKLIRTSRHPLRHDRREYDQVAFTSLKFMSGLADKVSGREHRSQRIISYDEFVNQICLCSERRYDTNLADEALINCNSLQFPNDSLGFHSVDSSTAWWSYHIALDIDPSNCRSLRAL